MEETAGIVLSAIGDGRRITVYGDFDCDGVCATSILVRGIRELGGDCDWFIPDRISEGYGLSPEAIRGLAERGTKLLISVDCGVTAVEEVALARELGMEIVITDHHQAGPELPDCPILHPVISRYPFPALCGAAVASKLASALRRGDASNAATSHPVPRSDRDDADLDLVALATVADVMPLEGENRHLVREGVKIARRARRPGMAALMAETRVEPSSLGAEDFGFRLGPRINAAGRMQRADAGVELFLSDSKDRAIEIAAELGAVNADRRRVEREVEREARAALKELGEPGPAVVVAGEGWHPGVVGIVASKLVKLTGRPSVVVALDGETGRGSARSVPGLDLHDAIGESADLLETFGGHAAAAGLSIRRERIGEFRDALGRAVAARIGTAPAEPGVEFDAVAGGSDLGLDLAEELERLQPFGNGNPAVKLLVPGARIENLREMGEGKHCRFSVCSGSSRANAVCFGRTSFGLREGERADVVAELCINHWNGSIEPQLRVSDVLPAPEAEPLPGCEKDEWWQRFELAMEENLEKPGAEAAGEIGEIPLAASPQGLPGVAIAELISSGERIAILTADANQRWSGLRGTGLSRFLPELPDRDPALPLVAGVWAGSPVAETGLAVGAGGEPGRGATPGAQILVTDFASLEAGTGGGAFRPAGFDLAQAGFERIALLDVPYTEASLALLARSHLPIHLLAGPDEIGFSARVAAHRLDLTAQLRNLFRALRDGARPDSPHLDGETLRETLSADGQLVRSPEQAALLLRVLIETGLARSTGVGGARNAGVVSSERTDLSASAVFVHHVSLHKDHERFLNHFNRQTQRQ